MAKRKLNHINEIEKSFLGNILYFLDKNISAVFKLKKILLHFQTS